MEEEEALKRKLKGRRQDAVAAGYERRSLLESGDQLEAPKSSAARRDTIRNCREARRPSMPDGSSAGPSARIESLMKPTTANKMRSTDKRKTETPLEEKKTRRVAGRGRREAGKVGEVSTQDFDLPREERGIS